MGTPCAPVSPSFWLARRVQDVFVYLCWSPGAHATLQAPLTPSMGWNYVVPYTRFIDFGVVGSNKHMDLVGLSADGLNWSSQESGAAGPTAKGQISKTRNKC